MPSYKAKDMESYVCETQRKNGTSKKYKASKLKGGHEKILLLRHIMLSELAF